MNSESVAKSYDAVTRAHAGDRAEDAVPYRHFNNYVKKTLINDAVRHYTANGLRVSGGGKASSVPAQLSVLDIASGRGGDLRKLLFINRAGRDAGHAPVVSSIHGFDISPECVLEATKRATEVAIQQPALGAVSYEVADTFSPEFWAALAERQQQRTMPMFDLTACFFALHYGCRSRASIDAVMAGIAQTLRPGGLFFGTIVDAVELTKRLLSKEGIKSTHLQNDLFSVRLCAVEEQHVESTTEFVKGQVDGSAVPVGFHYYFRLEDLVDADEFAIPFSTLEEIALTHGLVPVSALCRSFSDAIFAWNGDKTKLRQFGDGTELSQPERDLVTLYRTFCFEKALA